MMQSVNLYLDLIKRALNNYLYLGGDTVFEQYDISRFWSSDSGWTIPDNCQPHCLAATPKLNALHSMMLDVMHNNVPGDFIEAGVYKGGMIIFMRAFLEAYNIKDRVVWAADSFEGIPISESRELNDTVDLWEDRWIASFNEVLSNLKRYGLLDRQVEFIKGYFSETLPDASVDRLALARLDADSYESTMDALTGLYPKMSPGGYIIIDDWHINSCRQAVIEYRETNNISDPIHLILGVRRPDNAYEAFWKVGGVN